MIKKYKTIDVAGYPVHSDSIEKISLNWKEKVVINTINQYSYCVAKKDENFKTSLVKSDILLPDGIAIVAAVRFLTGNKLTKISGADIHTHLLKELNNQGGRCFYLGASENTLNKIKQKLASEFPRIAVGIYSPPFKSNFTKDDNLSMVSAVNNFNPTVLFIGMTAPKQEKWAFDNKDKLDVKIVCTIGAVFDFYACTVKRPGKFWIDLGLEWLVRFSREPKRLWKRYFYYGPVFIWLIIMEKIKFASIKEPVMFKK